MLRVDHAGEYGATRIYQGQLDVLGRSRAAGEIRRMAETEKGHLARFEELLQAGYLAEEDPALQETVLAFRDDELAHREIAIAHGAEGALGYGLISSIVKAGSRIAIWLSTRL